MNKLFVGTKNKIVPTGPCLFIHDEVPKMPLVKVFDPTKHSLDPLRNITERQARDLAEVLFNIAPEEGRTTLTIRKARRALAPALFEADRFDLIESDNEEVQGLKQEILFLPVLRDVLTAKNPIFALKPHTIVVARLNRAQIGEYSALVLGLILMSIYNGQIVVPDLGFYGRDAHTGLIRENRLIAGVNYLNELPLNLRRTALLIDQRTPNGALHEDAEVLARLAGHRPNNLREDNDFNRFVTDAMA